LTWIAYVNSYWQQESCDNYLDTRRDVGGVFARVVLVLQARRKGQPDQGIVPTG